MSQSAFAAALLDPVRAVPDGLTDPQGRPAGSRFDVYRNNVAASLTRALEEGFPALRALVGAEFFGAMALVHLRRHPPRDPCLMTYGADMPAFLERFPPVAHLPYLSDVARIELALRGSYHAGDHHPLDPAALGAMPPETLEAFRPGLAPSVRLLRLATPALAVWQRARGGTAPVPAGSQDVLIARAGYDPVPHLLPPGGHALLSALAAGATLGEAFAAAGAETPDADPGATLGLALATSILTDPET